MAIQAHYNQDWVKLNAPWSKGTHFSMKPPESIYWRNCPVKVIGYPNDLFDGDLGFNINNSRALVGQDFIGESDVHDSEGQGHEFTNNHPYDFGNMHSIPHGVHAPRHPIPPPLPLVGLNPHAPAFIPPYLVPGANLNNNDRLEHHHAVLGNPYENEVNVHRELHEHVQEPKTPEKKRPKRKFNPNSKASRFLRSMGYSNEDIKTLPGGASNYIEEQGLHGRYQRFN